MSEKVKYSLLLCTLFVVSFLLFFHPVTDFSQDLGRHIKLGEIILSTHTVPTTNLFSYTYPNFPFINSHWLSEVVFYLLFRIAGTQGLLFAMSTLGALSFVLLVSIVKKQNSVVVFLSSILFLSILLERVYLRPEIFSFFFLACFLVILYRYAEKSVIANQSELVKQSQKGKGIATSVATLLPRNDMWKYLIFLLPVVEVFWVNMHIYFAIGPLLIFLFLADALISNLKPFDFTSFRSGKNSLLLVPMTRQSESLSKHMSIILNTKYLILVFILSCLATFLNPNGIKGALYPLTVFHNYGYSIEENQSLSFLANYGFWYPWFTIYVCTTGILFLLLLIKRKRTSLLDWLLAIIFTILGFAAVRNFSLFVFGSFVPFVSVLGKARLSIKFPHSILLTLCGIAAVLLVWLGTSTNGLGIDIVPSAEHGVDFFVRNHLKGPIFNNFDIGSYLDYRLYPNDLPANASEALQAGKVFVDGRPEAYPVSFFQNIYIPMQQNPKIFQQQDKKYNFQTIFFSYSDQTPWAKTFLASLSQNPGWSLVYLDGFSAIWVKNNMSNNTLIEHFSLTPQNFSFQDIHSTDINDYLHLAYFFSLVRWQQPEIATLEKVVDLSPANCMALSILSQNPSTSLLYSQRYASTCH